MFIEVSAPLVQIAPASRPPGVPTKLHCTSWVPFWPRKPFQCDQDILDDENGFRPGSTTGPSHNVAVPSRKKQVSTPHPNVSCPMLTRFLLSSRTHSSACSLPFMRISLHGRPLLSSNLSSIQTRRLQPYLPLSRPRARPARMCPSLFIGWRKLSGQRRTTPFG